MGIANPRLIGNNLVVDEMDGTEVVNADVVVGNVRGNKGDKGPMPTLVVTAEPGGEELQPVAAVSETPTGYRLALKNTKGRTPVITASAETSPAGSTAQVWATPTDAGTNLAFTVPRGDKGETGPVGPMPDLAFRTLANDPTLSPEIMVEKLADGTGYTVTLNHVKGPVGPVGPAPRLEMEQPVNLPAGAQPLADMWQVNPGVYRIRLSIPMGQPGAASDSIRDDQISFQTSWSSEYTAAQIAALLDDSVTAAGTGWSSQKIADAIDSVRVTELAWSQIKGKPATFPPAAHSHAWDQITGKPSVFPPAGHSHSWGEITGKPSSFVPASHKHNASDVNAGVFDPKRLPAATASAQGAVTVDAEALSDSPTGVPSSALVQSMLGQVTTGFDFTLDHADWAVNFAKGVMDAGSRVVSFTLRMSTAKAATWSANRRQIGRIPPAFAPSTSFAINATVRHSGKWASEVVEVADNGAIYLMNSETIKLDAATQLNISMNWLAK